MKLITVRWWPDKVSGSYLNTAKVDVLSILTDGSEEKKNYLLEMLVCGRGKLMRFYEKRGIIIWSPQRSKVH